MIEGVLDQFRGQISQLPPIYSALKMDGKPLYEYARAGTPLPRPIAARSVTVHNLELVDWQEGSATSESDPSSKITAGHKFTWPEKVLSEEDKVAMDNVKKLIDEAGVEVDDPAVSLPATLPTTNTAKAEESISSTAEETRSPPVFMLKMTVSSGTYVRSIVHDIAQALGSAAHVVTLTRTRQGEFAVGPQYLTSTSGPSTSKLVVVDGEEKPFHPKYGDCVPWELFEQALERRERGEEVSAFPAEGEQWEEWEKAVLANWQAPTAVRGTLPAAAPPHGFTFTLGM